MVVPSPPFPPDPPFARGPRHDPLPPSPKEVLRQAALAARKAFVRSLDDAARTRLEQRLAERLTALCAGASIVAGYAPMGSEISPLRSIEEARAVGAIVAFPAFRDPAKPFRFLAGDPAEGGPFGMLQPRLTAPEVKPDLILVPLIAIDGLGTRLGRGKGHYDRVLGALRRDGARLIGIGWGIERVPVTIPCDSWDVPLDSFVSPDSFEEFARGR